MKPALLRFLLTEGKICLMVTPQDGHECLRYEISGNSLLAALADITDIVYRLFAKRLT
jgi:hypothetical protein